MSTHWRAVGKGIVAGALIAGGALAHHVLKGRFPVTPPGSVAAPTQPERPVALISTGWDGDLTEAFGQEEIRSALVQTHLRVLTALAVLPEMQEQTVSLDIHPDLERMLRHSAAASAALN